MKGARTRTRRIDENWVHQNSLADIVSDVRKLYYQIDNA